MSLRTIQQKGQGNDYWKRIERCKLINSKTHQLKNSLTQKLTNSKTHQLTNSSTHQLINSKTYQLKNSKTHQLTSSLAQKLTNSKTHQLTSSLAQKLKNLPTQKLINLKTHQLKNLPTQKLTNSKNYQHKNSPTQKLKLLLFILQNSSSFRPILAKIQVKKQVNNHCFSSFMSFALSVFRSRTCILHHLAFLFGRPLAIFSLPNTRIQSLKSHFLMAILPFSVMFFMVRKGFVYTISADIYAFRLAFSGKKYFIQHHFSLRLAPKRTAFSTKIHCVQRHFALHLAPNCTTFCCKWPKIQCKR